MLKSILKMLKSILKEVNTIVILVFIPVLLIVIASFVSLSWINLWLALLIGLAGCLLNLFVTWLLLTLASKKGIAQKPLHESSPKWANGIIMALLIVIIISSVMVFVLEVSVMAPIIMTAFICMAIPAAYLCSNGILADMEI